jgi:hypothetical protein
MPLAFDPEQVAEFTLKSDEARPPERRATFRSRHLTGRDSLKLRRIVDEIRELRKDDDVLAKLGEAFGIGITHLKAPDGEWQPFAVEAALGLLTLVEMYDLLDEWPSRVTEIEISLRKK